MIVYAVESRWDVPGGPWLPWSDTHWYKSASEAEKAMKRLNHKQHPVPTMFRVQEYGPVGKDHIGHRSQQEIRDCSICTPDDSEAARLRSIDDFLEKIWAELGINPCGELETLERIRRLRNPAAST